MGTEVPMWRRLLTDWLEQNTYWEANVLSATREIRKILWNTKVHYRIHNSPQPGSILIHLNQVHVPKSHNLKIHFNIILPSTNVPPKWTISVRILH